MILAHKIALDPTCKQRTQFSKAAGCARFAYNWGLAWWKREYAAGRKPNANLAKKAFNQIKGKQFPWVYESPKDANQEAFSNLGDAYTRFFKKQSKYPRPHKLKRGQSFGVSNDKFQLVGSVIQLPKIGKVRMRESLRFTGKILSAAVSRTADRWFVSIRVDINHPHVAKAKQSVVGIDLGLKSAIVVFDGTMYNAPKPMKRYLSKLRTLQRSLRRRVKGSSRREVTKNQIARLHARIANIRKDFIHKVTTEIAQKHSVICLEDLHVKGMVKNHKLARAISDVGFGEIRRQFEYKAKLSGARVVVADRWFPSTQTCFQCGCVRTVKLSLADRTFICEHCGFEIDRDLNAAKNLSTLGLRESYAQGQTVRPLARKAKASLVELRTNPCALVHTS